MFTPNSLEDKLQYTEKVIQELERQQEALTRQAEEYFEALQFKAEEVDAILSNRANFSDAAWDYLQKEREELEKKLQRKIDAIHVPKKKARPVIPNHALFVR